MAQEIWDSEIMPKIVQVMSSSTPLTFAEHSAAYTAVYQCVTSARRADETRRELHTLTGKFFAEHTKSIATGAPGDDAELTAYYDAEWDRFSKAVKVVDRLLNQLNRHYVQRVRDEGNKEILAVRNLAFKSWKSNVFDILSPRLEGVNKTRVDAVRELLASEELLDEKLQGMRLG
ncbi:CULLIN-2 domain-containing protein [Favolaschia claudopus]|uniref:CULLIN-2 domain-containing protein n=1 Tax=Favolaschia claudopus TaxID=2862362 RepID=A0AAV9ZM89_9AGAR